MTRRQTPVEQDEDLAQVVTGHGPCTYLLVALLALILIYPYLRESIVSRIVLGLLYSLVLLGGVYAIGRDKRKLSFGLGLAIIAMTGYGDILPLIDQTRSFAILEQFVGVLIARLAGLYPPVK